MQAFGFFQKFERVFCFLRAFAEVNGKPLDLGYAIP
jgi:hypothetical protein